VILIDLMVIVTVSRVRVWGTRR